MTKIKNNDVSFYEHDFLFTTSALGVLKADIWEWAFQNFFSEFKANNIKRSDLIYNFLVNFNFGSELFNPSKDFYSINHTKTIWNKGMRVRLTDDTKFIAANKNEERMKEINHFIEMLKQLEKLALSEGISLEDIRQTVSKNIFNFAQEYSNKYLDYFHNKTNKQYYYEFESAIINGVKKYINRVWCRANIIRNQDLCTVAPLWVRDNHIKMNLEKEKSFWNTKGKEMYADGKYEDPTISDYEFALINKITLSGKNILELGPGSGRDIKKFNHLKMNLNAIDISQSFIKNLQENFTGNFIEGDLRQMAKHFKDIDLIYTRWSILFLTFTEFQALLRNALEVLNENGKILISLREGDSLENIHATTKLQSLQLNVQNLVKAVPNQLRIDFVEVKEYASSREKNDRQITFILTKNSEDKRNGIYK